MIALIDYGAGNLTSVRKAFAAIGAEIVVPTSPDEVGPASAVVVPGVGHIRATRALHGAWTEAILARVGEGRPLLGICLGMQWLFEGSEEAPGTGPEVVLDYDVGGRAELAGKRLSVAATELQDAVGVEGRAQRPDVRDGGLRGRHRPGGMMPRHAHRSG